MHNYETLKPFAQFSGLNLASDVLKVQVYVRHLYSQLLVNAAVALRLELQVVSFSFFDVRELYRQNDHH